MGAAAAGGGAAEDVIAQVRLVDDHRNLSSAWPQLHGSTDLRPRTARRLSANGCRRWPTDRNSMEQLSLDTTPGGWDFIEVKSSFLKFT